MTKVIILGTPQDENKPKKKIEFTHYLDSSGFMQKGFCNDPKSFNHIELICKNYTQEGLDLMYAYREDRQTFKCLYLGHFNDGIV